MKKNRIITVQDIPVTITQTELEDYICITDIAAANKIVKIKAIND